MRTHLRKGQKEISSFRVALPNNNTLEFEIYTQDDGGVYVTQYMQRQNGGVQAGETCFYCDGVKIGCVTCGPGQVAVGNCITKQAYCEPLGGHSGTLEPEGQLQGKK